MNDIEKAYQNQRVKAVLDGIRDFAPSDFLDLALVAVDQGSCGVPVMGAIRRLNAVAFAIRPIRDLADAVENAVEVEEIISLGGGEYVAHWTWTWPAPGAIVSTVCEVSYPDEIQGDAPQDVLDTVYAYHCDRKRDRDEDARERAADMARGH